VDVSRFTVPVDRSYQLILVKRICGGTIPPSGSNGLMLGEIFGRNAGLTCTELALFRFLLGRPAGFESNRLPTTDPVGEATALSCGLGMTELEALVSDALGGPSLGVFFADSVGVV